MSQRRRDTLPKKRNAAGGSASQRRISRREREERQRRQLYIGLAIAGVLSIVILAGFALNDYWFKPRAVLASVNGTEIRRRDYWKVRSVELVNQVNQYNQFSQLVDPSQQQQYLTLAQQAAAAVPTEEQYAAMVQQKLLPSNLTLDTDGVPYINPGANSVVVLNDTDGRPYFV